MGRKKKEVIPEVNPELAAPLITLLYRGVEAIRPPGNLAPAQAEARVKRAEAAIGEVAGRLLAYPAMREYAGKLLTMIDAKSENEWRQISRDFLAGVAEQISKAYLTLGLVDPLAGVSAEEKPEILLKLSGCCEGIDDVTVRAREEISSFLNQIASGNTDKLTKEIADVTAGLFSIDREKTLGLIDLALQVSGGPPLVEQVNAAVSEVRDRLFFSSTMALSVSLMSSRNPKSQLVEENLKATWAELKPKLVGKILGEKWRLPGSVIRTDKEPDGAWSEELAIAQESVFVELGDRVKNDPVGVLKEAWEGKLANSLALSAINDVIDRIRHLRVQKRDVLKEFSLDEEKGRFTEIDGSHPVNDLSSHPEPTALEHLISEERFAEFLQVSTDDERDIIMLLIDGYSGREIALKLGKSEAWVSGKKRRVYTKLMARRGA